MRFFLYLLNIFIFIALLPFIALAQPTVTITPSSGAPATVIKIDGNGFKPDEEVDIIITLEEGEKILLGTEKTDVVKTDANGTFSVSSGIPINAKAGLYKIDIVGSKGSNTQVNLEVKPAEKK